MSRDELLEIVFAGSTLPEEARKGFDTLAPEEQLQIIFDAGYHRGFDDGVLTCRYAEDRGDSA